MCILQYSVTKAAILFLSHFVSSTLELKSIDYAHDWCFLFTYIVGWCRMLSLITSRLEWVLSLFYIYSLFILLNSLAPRRVEWNCRAVIFKLILMIDGWGISWEIVLTWMPQDLTDDKSTLVQVMAWCHQATSHYLNQCWPSALSPYGVTRPQWVKFIATCRSCVIYVREDNDSNV